MVFSQVPRQSVQCAVHMDEMSIGIQVACSSFKIVNSSASSAPLQNYDDYQYNRFLEVLPNITSSRCGSEVYKYDLFIPTGFLPTKKGTCCSCTGNEIQTAGVKVFSEFHAIFFIRQLANVYQGWLVMADCLSKIYDSIYHLFSIKTLSANYGIYCLEMCSHEYR